MKNTSAEMTSRWLLCLYHIKVYNSTFNSFVARIDVKVFRIMVQLATQMENVNTKSQQQYLLSKTIYTIS